MYVIVQIFWKVEDLTCSFLESLSSLTLELLNRNYVCLNEDISAAFQMRNSNFASPYLLKNTCSSSNIWKCEDLI